MTDDGYVLGTTRSDDPNTIPIDGGSDVVGITTHGWSTNNTRSVLVNPYQLYKWAEAVNHTYNEPVRVHVTPEAPIFAGPNEAEIGISVCPLQEGDGE